MERRDFLKKTTIGSTCAIAGSLLATETSAKNSEKVAVKITIMERAVNNKWSKEVGGYVAKACDLFHDGQEFTITSPWDAPQGFCQWAWADIRTYIHLVMEGRYETMINCCTDGMRPVYFKLERVVS